jgi:hypothetical protein
MWVVGLALAAASVHAQPVPPAQVVPSAYERAARWEGVPARLLFALALQESGLPLHGRLIPWPWTLNIDGVAQRYANRWDACAALRRALQRQPATGADVGLGQINVRYHGARVSQPCELLEPYRNLALTAAILREQHRAGEDWLLAVGRYHRPAGGTAAARYQRSVEQYLTRLSQIPPPHTTSPAVDP